MRRISFFLFIQPTVSEHILLQSRYGLTLLRQSEENEHLERKLMSFKEHYFVLFFFSFPDQLFVQDEFNLSTLEKSITMFE